jgi:hypothetical protein
MSEFREAIKNFSASATQWRKRTLMRVGRGNRYCKSGVCNLGLCQARVRTCVLVLMRQPFGVRT